MADRYGNILVYPFACTDPSGFSALLNTHELHHGSGRGEKWHVHATWGNKTAACIFDVQYPEVIPEIAVYEDDDDDDPTLMPMNIKDWVALLKPFIKHDHLQMQVVSNQKADHFYFAELIVHADGRYFYVDSESATPEEKLNGYVNNSGGKV